MAITSTWAVTPLTKIVYVCLPNNPTGTTNTRAELGAYFDRVPEHIVTVLDQAYLEYIDDPDYPDGVEEYLKQGRRVVVLRMARYMPNSKPACRITASAVTPIKMVVRFSIEKIPAALRCSGQRRRAKATGF